MANNNAGFRISQRGRPTLGVANLLFGIIFAENCMRLKILNREGARVHRHFQICHWICQCYQCCQFKKTSNVSGQVVSVSKGCTPRLTLGTRPSCSRFVSPSSKTVKRLHRKSHHAPRRWEQVTTRLIKTYRIAFRVFPTLYQIHLIR